MRTLTLSHSSVEMFEICPQLYYLKYVLGRSASGCTAPLLLGNAMHRALAVWHRHRDLALATNAIGTWDAEGEDLTPEFAEMLLEKYAKRYATDPDIVDVLFTERTFCFPLGAVGDVDVHFAGTLDLLADPSRPFLIDHKTSALGWPIWWAGQRVSSQWPAYAWGAGGLTGNLVSEVCVNHISTRASVPESERFTRARLSITPEAIGEWRADTLQTARAILACHESDVWPHARNACTRQHGRSCDFYNLCVLPPAVRMRDLARSGEWITRAPSPTEKRFPMGLGDTKRRKTK